MGKLQRPTLPDGPLNELMEALHDLHARAGRPSTRQMARGQNFSYTAVHDLFTKTISEPPKLPVLSAVVEYLAQAAPRTNVDDTLDKFDALWMAASGAKEQTKRVSGGEAGGVRINALQLRVLELMAEGQPSTAIAAQVGFTDPGLYGETVAHLLLALGASTKLQAIRKARALRLLDERIAIDAASRPAMTKELFFLAAEARPLHDAAAELRRAGYLVRDQPQDLDGTWSLMAYSAASELSENDLATLSDIAARCRVEFDGWGTYVGPPEMDDGPGQRARR